MGKKPTPPPSQHKKRGRKPKRRNREETRSHGSTVSSSASASRSSRTGRIEDVGLRQPEAINEETMLQIQSEIDSFFQVTEQNLNQNLQVTELAPSSPNYTSTENFETSGLSLSQRGFSNELDEFLYKLMNDPNFEDIGDCSDLTAVPDVFTELADFERRYQIGNPTANSTHSVTGLWPTEIQNYTTNVPISEPFNPTASSSFQVPDLNETPNANGVQPALFSIEQILMNEPEGYLHDELYQYIENFENLLTEFSSNNNQIQSSTSHKHNNELETDNGEIDLGQTENQPDPQTQDSPTSQSFNLPASFPNQTLSASVPADVSGNFANLELLANVACDLVRSNPPFQDSVVQDQIQDNSNSELHELGSATANNTTAGPLPASLPNQTVSASFPAEVPGCFANLELLADVACDWVRSNPLLRDSVVQDQTQNIPTSEVPELGSDTVNNTTAVPIAGPSSAAPAVSHASSSDRITLSQIAGAFVDVASIFRYVQNTENLVQTAGYPLHGFVRNVIRSYNNSVGKGWPEMPMPMPMSGATCEILLDEPSSDPRASPEVIDLVSSDEDEADDKENRRK